MKMNEKVVLVCLGKRTREVTFSPPPDESDVKALERVIREVFMDLDLKSNSQLILKVLLAR